MTSGRGMLSVDECDGASAVHCVAAAATCYFVDVFFEISLEIQSLARSHYLPLPSIHSSCSHSSSSAFRV